MGEEIKKKDITSSLLSVWQRLVSLRREEWRGRERRGEKEERKRIRIRHVGVHVYVMV